MIPYGKHYLDDDDIQSVVNVLKDGFLTQGPKVAEFEKVLADKVGVKYAVAVSSGTAALHLACLAAEIGKGSVVYTSANTFVASANCVLYVGGKPEFCDIDEKTLNMSPEFLAEHASNHGGMDAVIPVHFGGTPCDMDAIKMVADKYNATVIEDASHAFGARYPNGNLVGNCEYSDMTVFSLHPVKGVTAGEGGVITTNDNSLYKRLLSLRSHGICKGNFDLPGVSIGDGSLVYQDEAVDDGVLNPWYYEMQELGFNYRITDFQCALALSQLTKVDKFLQRRREIASIYDHQLVDFSDVTMTQVESRALSSLHLYVLRIDFEAIGKKRGQVMRDLFDRDIGSQVHYIPVPFHPFYAEKGYKMSDFPETEKYYRQALTIPIYYGLSDDSVEEVIGALREVLY
ncbi:MAG: UDP-4-amino-4,6-dideoxy-N-acetyl-beta-L-altrosamine transaminase [Pseudomonadota bacterium]